MRVVLNYANSSHSLKYEIIQGVREIYNVYDISIEANKLN